MDVTSLQVASAGFRPQLPNAVLAMLLLNTSSSTFPYCTRAALQITLLRTNLGKIASLHIL